jgi:hypothetical protein
VQANARHAGSDVSRGRARNEHEWNSPVSPIGSQASRSPAPAPTVGGRVSCEPPTSPVRGKLVPIHRRSFARANRCSYKLGDMTDPSASQRIVLGALLNAHPRLLDLRQLETQLRSTYARGSRRARGRRTRDQARRSRRRIARSGALPADRPDLSCSASRAGHPMRGRGRRGDGRYAQRPINPPARRQLRSERSVSVRSSRPRRTSPRSGRSTGVRCRRSIRR